MDIAASIQVVLEQIIKKITKSLSNKYKIKNLCMLRLWQLIAVANGKVLKSREF